MLKQMIPAVGHAAFPVVPAAGQMARMPVRLAAVLTAAHGKTPAEFKLNNLVTPNSKHPLNKLLIGWGVQLYSKYACMGLTQCLVVTRWTSYRGIGHLGLTPFRKPVDTRWARYQGIGHLGHA